MFDLRYSGMFAVGAFILSLLIGLISRSTMPMLIIRPLIFAVIFFVFSAFLKILVGRFLPELLENSADEGGIGPGSRINIMEGDAPPDSSAVTEGFISANLSQISTGAKPDDADDDLGDISELSKRISLGVGGDFADEESIPGIDQNPKERYTDNGGLSDSAGPDFSKMFSPDSQFEASSGGQARGTGANAAANAGVKKGSVSGSNEDLPDLDSMAEAFMSGSSDEEQGTKDYSAPKRTSSSKEPPKWAEEFDAKEMAMGIRTALKKDKES